MNENRWAYTFGKKTLDLSSRTHIIGILNVTPDSFSDGGKYVACDTAVERGLQMIVEGADIIDVGGESTRPAGSVYGEGAEPVSVEEELRRVLPVITQLAGQTDTPISIDTYKAEVAEQAIAAGAAIVNDISGFQFDARMAQTVGNMGASAILMHIKGSPKTMQLNPEYEDLLDEISNYLSGCVTIARKAGVKQIFVDPGIGFGKLQTHNLQLLRRLEEFQGLGCPIVVGASRKGFIGKLLNLPIESRLEGSLASAVVASMYGANVVRVHDVLQTKRALTVTDAIKGAPYH